LARPEEREFVRSAFKPETDPIIRTMVNAANEYVRIQQQAQTALIAQQQNGAKILIENLPNAAQEFRRIIVQSANEAAASLSQDDRIRRFSGGGVLDPLLAGNIASPGNLGELVRGGGGAEFNVPILRNTLSQLNFNNDALQKLVSNRAFTGTESNFEILLAANKLDEIRNAIKEGSFNIDLNTFEKLLSQKTVSFNQNAIDSLIKSGAIHVKLEGLSKLQRLPEDIAENIRTQLQIMINEYRNFVFQQRNPVARKNGGLIYANEGRFVNFQPRGTDTIPAMLTPGEFVVNARATAKNLPLLKAINDGAKGYSSGGIVYLQRGGRPDIDELGRFNTGNDTSSTNNNAVVNQPLTRQQILDQRKTQYQAMKDARRAAFESTSVGARIKQNREKRQEEKESRLDSRRDEIEDYLSEGKLIESGNNKYKYRLRDGSYSGDTSLSAAVSSLRKNKKQKERDTELLYEYELVDLPVSPDDVLGDFGREEVPIERQLNNEQRSRLELLDKGRKLANEAGWNLFLNDFPIGDGAGWGFTRSLSEQERIAFDTYVQYKKDKFARETETSLKEKKEEEEALRKAKMESDYAASLAKARVESEARQAELMTATKAQKQKDQELRDNAVKKFNTIYPDIGNKDLYSIIQKYGEDDDFDMMLNERNNLSGNKLSEARIQEIIDRASTAYQNNKKEQEDLFIQREQAKKQLAEQQQAILLRQEEQRIATIAKDNNLFIDPLTGSVGGVSILEIEDLKKELRRYDKRNTRTGQSITVGEEWKKLEDLEKAIIFTKNIASETKRQRISDTEGRYSELKMKADKDQLKGSDAIEYARLARERGISWKDLPGASFRTDQIIREESIASQFAARDKVLSGDETLEPDLKTAMDLRKQIDTREVKEFQDREVTSITPGGLLIAGSMITGDMLGGGGGNITDEMVRNYGSFEIPWDPEAGRSFRTPGLATLIDLAADATNFAPGLPAGAGRAAKGLSRAAQASRRSRTGVGSLLRDMVQLDDAGLSRPQRISRSRAVGSGRKASGPIDQYTGQVMPYENDAALRNLATTPEARKKLLEQQRLALLEEKMRYDSQVAKNKKFDENWWHNEGELPQAKLFLERPTNAPREEAIADFLIQENRAESLGFVDGLSPMQQSMMQNTPSSSAAMSVTPKPSVGDKPVSVVSSSATTSTSVPTVPRGEIPRRSLIEMAGGEEAFNTPSIVAAARAEEDAIRKAMTSSRGVPQTRVEVIENYNPMTRSSSIKERATLGAVQRLMEDKPDITAQQISQLLGVDPAFIQQYMLGNIPVQGFVNGGIVYANKGTMIPYSPRGTDTVPAMLTPGEFVVNRKAAQQNLGLLKSINSGGAQYLNKGGVVQYLQNGGSVNGGAAGINFNEFSSAVASFGTYVSILQDSFSQIQNLDFGVFKTSVDSLISSFAALNGPANLFNNAAIAFGNNITSITTAINALANIPNTINIAGRIDIPTNITVSLEGNTGDLSLEIKKDILNAVANALSQNNPGINVDKLREQP
jgi:hypothetical protein